MPKKKLDKKGKKKIVVNGDITIDWLEVTTPPAESKEKSPNWQTYSRTRQFARPGGALLLAHFIRTGTGAKVLSPNLRSIEKIPPRKIIHSITLLDQFRYSTYKEDKENMVYRVREFKGYAGPSSGTPNFFKVENDAPDATILVLDDADNGFRDVSMDCWPAALMKGKPEFVIFKMSRPNVEGKLWDKLQRDHADRLILVINADDLRRAGVYISRRLSWERTAKDFVWQMASNSNLAKLNNYAYLIVKFGVEGTILHRRRAGVVKSQLFYNPKIGEDSFSEFHPGVMLGTGAVFVAALTASLYKKGLEGIEEGVRQGLVSACRLWQHGFGKNTEKLDYPGVEIFEKTEKDSITIKDIVIPNPTDIESADPHYWRILDDRAQTGLENMAYKYVENGTHPDLGCIPIGEFGKFKTFDRSEIESFSSIENLIRQYLNSPEIHRPLSIGVFGPPGSGKSFGVTEVAKSVATGELSDEPLEFNLSQFTSIDELIAAFHIVRDITLGGKIPITFFDEFDCEFNGKFGWLKYFLAPMQDGTFREGEAIHPIGRAIFVFAGGIRDTFAEFCKEATDPELKSAKGIDFVSRLRGHVDIKGPNPVPKNERFHVIRRALFLRYLLENQAKSIFIEKKCHIDPGVLRAMIKIPEYKHGIRSMQAIIEMSMLAKRKKFEQAALPSPEQLDMHVDAEMFSRLVVRDVLLTGAVEKLAEAIHEKYREERRKEAKKKKKRIRGPAMLPWDKLPEYLKKTNREQAKHIAEKLKAIDCDYAPVVDRKPKLIKFTKEEIEIMAEMEHIRWCEAKRFDQWRHGSRKSAKKKTHPYLLEWEKLSDKIQEIDRKAVRAIPKLLAKAGFEIYRLKPRV